MNDVYILGWLYNDFGAGGFAIIGVFATEAAAIAAYEEATDNPKKIVLFRADEHHSNAYDCYAIDRWEVR
jgi:hypothetical protein